MKMWLNRAQRVKRYNGVGSRGPLKGPLMGSRGEALGVQGVEPREAFGVFCILKRLNVPILESFSLPCRAHLKKKF